MASETNTSVSWQYPDEDTERVLLHEDGEEETLTEDFEDCVEDERAKSEAAKAKRDLRKKAREEHAALDVLGDGVILKGTFSESASPMEEGDDAKRDDAVEKELTVPIAVQQTVDGLNMPFKRRSARSTATMLQAWMGNKFVCPYEGCSFVPSGCRRTNITIEGTFYPNLVIRPDRYCEQADHWWCRHMVEPLELRCHEGACNRTFVYTTKFREHLKSHKLKAEDVATKVRLAKEAFCEVAGEEASTSDLSDLLRWPTRYYTASEAKRKSESSARVTIKATRSVKTKVEEPKRESVERTQKTGRIETIDTTREGAVSHKQAVETIVKLVEEAKPLPALVTPKRPLEATQESNRIDILSMALKRRKLDDWMTGLEPSSGTRLSQNARNQVRCSMGFIRAKLVKVLEALDSGVNLLELDGEFRKREVNLMADRLRNVFNEGRDQLDGAARGLGDWQRQLGNNPPSRMPSMLLVNTEEWNCTLGIKGQLVASKRQVDNLKKDLEANICLMDSLKTQLSKVRADLIVASATSPIVAPANAVPDDTSTLTEPSLASSIQGMDPTIPGLNFGPVFLTDSELVTMRGCIMRQWDHYLRYYKRSVEIVETIQALELMKVKGD